MKRFITAGLATALVLFPIAGYLYIRGAVDGVEQYRRSKQFKMTLYAIYTMGVQDGCAGNCPK